MRRYFIACVLITLTIASISVAQQKKIINVSKLNYPVQSLRGDGGNNFFPSTSKIGLPSSHLSPLVTVSGADILPISTKWDNETNGRSLHSLVRDPDDPQKLHFIAMALDDNTENDTVGAKFNSRRVVYTYSSNGGKTWTPQEYIDSSIRLGYPDIILYKRGGVNVPIIAAHNGPNGANNNDWTTKLYIEQGKPGDGKFKKFTADQKSSGGKTKDIGYPSLGLSLNQDTLYVLGCVLTTGTISATNPTQPLEFGAFSLDANRNASWLGWKNNPGGKDLKGHVASGKDLLRVAPNGKIGAMWSSDSNYVCYVESFDGGKTWTSKYAALYQAPTKQILASNQKTYNCSFAGCDGMDLWYDQSSTAHFLWQAYWVAGSGTYFPLNSTAIFSWKFGDNTVTIPAVFNDPTIASLVMFDTLTATVNTLNPVDYFTATNIPSGDPPPNSTTLWNPTPILSTNPNKWGIVYETFQDGDQLAVDVFGDGSTTATRLFRNLYSTITKDGGVNWSAPTPYRANDPASDPSIKNDYHFPSTPIFNPEKLGNIVSDVNFSADTCPGPVVTGQGVWDDNTWYHQSFILASVHFTNSNENISLSQNYPNPFTSSTTIPLVMKNDDMVTLSVTDMLGREVSLIYHGRLSAGEHRIPFTAPNLGAGIYTYTLKTSEGSVSRTMSLVK